MNEKGNYIENGEWDLVLKPTTSYFQLNLKEVWQYKDLLMLFVKRDFVAQYKQTILGPLWHFIQPILTTLIFLFVFGKIAKIPTDGIPPVLFYMSGITFWNYFSSCLLGTSGTFTANAAIFGKVYFPRLVIPLSVIASNIIKLGIQLCLLLVVCIYYHFRGFPMLFQWQLLLIPFYIMVMAFTGLGIGVIVSSLTTKYRDFSVLISFAMQLLMYATPVVYPLSYLQGKSYKWVVAINPLTYIIEALRCALFNRGTFYIPGIAYSIGFMAVVLFFGVVIFNKVEKNFMDTV